MSHLVLKASHVDWGETFKNFGAVVGTALGIFNWWKARDRFKAKASVELVEFDGRKIRLKALVVNAGSKPFTIIEAVASRDAWSSHSRFGTVLKLDSYEKISEGEVKSFTFTVNDAAFLGNLVFRTQNGKSVWCFLPIKEVFSVILNKYLAGRFIEAGANVEVDDDTGALKITRGDLVCRLTCSRDGRMTIYCQPKLTPTDREQAIDILGPEFSYHVVEADFTDIVQYGEIDNPSNDDAYDMTRDICRSLGMSPGLRVDTIPKQGFLPRLW